MIHDFTSASATLPCEVPQSSNLGPLQFSLHLLPLGSIFRTHGVQFHLYVDDCQVYFPLNYNGSTQSLLDCLDDIRRCIAFNFLHFYEKKSELMIFKSGSPVLPPLNIPPWPQSENFLSQIWGWKWTLAWKLTARSTLWLSHPISTEKIVKNKAHIFYVTFRDSNTHFYHHVWFWSDLAGLPSHVYSWYKMVLHDFWLVQVNESM